MKVGLVYFVSLLVVGVLILWGSLTIRDHLAVAIYNSWELAGPADQTQVSLVSQQTKPSLVTFWAPHIDAISEAKWPEHLAAFRQLKAYGFTHIGVRIANPAKDVSARVAQLREIGLPFAYVSNAGHEILTKPEELDPETNPNGKNAKYFDTVGFDPYVCHGSSGCSGRPHVTAHDPAYVGTLWQRELEYLGAGLDKVGFRSGDVAIFDLEIWSDPSSGAEYYYPRVVLDSAIRYSGTAEERYQQYRNNVRARVNDLKQVVYRRSSGARILFYGETPGGVSDYSDTWLPAGTGDAPSPAFYWLPDLNKIENYFAEDNWSGSYPWISFSYSYTNRGDRTWSTDLTRQLGTLLRQEGARGVIVYPGPLDYPGVISVGSYLEHARALMEGFDPPPAPISQPEETNEPEPVVEEIDEQEEEEDPVLSLPDPAEDLPIVEPAHNKSREELIIEILLKILELKKKLLELLLAESR